MGILLFTVVEVWDCGHGKGGTENLSKGSCENKKIENRTLNKNEEEKQKADQFPNTLS